MLSKQQERANSIRTRMADRPRLATYLIQVVNDASDYKNDFDMRLTRSEIYTIVEALTQEK